MKIRVNFLGHLLCTRDFKKTTTTTTTINAFEKRLMVQLRVHLIIHLELYLKVQFKMCIKMHKKGAPENALKGTV